jgi:hypothetical protein
VVQLLGPVASRVGTAGGVQVWGEGGRVDENLESLESSRTADVSRASTDSCCYVQCTVEGNGGHGKRVVGVETEHWSSCTYNVGEPMVC